MTPLTAGIWLVAGLILAAIAVRIAVLIVRVAASSRAARRSSRRAQIDDVVGLRADDGQPHRAEGARIDEP